MHFSSSEVPPTDLSRRAILKWSNISMKVVSLQSPRSPHNASASVYQPIKQVVYCNNDNQSKGGVHDSGTSHNSSISWLLSTLRPRRLALWNRLLLLYSLNPFSASFCQSSHLGTGLNCRIHTPRQALETQFNNNEPS